MIGNGAADVERLEEVVHPVRGLDAEAQRQRLGLRRGVAAVLLDGTAICRLVLERQVEEVVHRRAETRDDLVGHAVAGDLDEADLAAGAIDVGGTAGHENAPETIKIAKSY